MMATDSSSGLLPCPFCGGAAEMVLSEDEDGRFAAVGCSKCGAGSRQHYFCGDDAREFAAGAWNCRPTPPSSASGLVEEVARINSALKSRPITLRVPQVYQDIDRENPWGAFADDLAALLSSLTALSAPKVSEVGELVRDLGQHVARLRDARYGGMWDAMAEDMEEAAQALTSLAEQRDRLERERDEARAGMAYILDHAVYGDSYGVPGSDFSCCHFCMGGGAPGVAMEHDSTCPVARYPDTVEEWFAEMADADARAQAAEQRADRLVEAVKAFLPFGCPVCGGDCGGDCGAANPPVTICPMREAEVALSEGKPTP